MNLIEEIARHIASGLKAAEVAVKLEAEHAIKVSEDWVRRIMGADGFSAALQNAQARSAEVEQAVVEAATDVVEDVKTVPGEGLEKLDEGAEKLESEAKDAEGKLVGEAGVKQDPALPPGTEGE